MAHTDYTYLDLAEEVLKKEKRAMTVPEIWECALEMGLEKKLISVGKTPKNTLNASIRRHISGSKYIRFRQISTKPARYYLDD